MKTAMQELIERMQSLMRNGKDDAGVRTAIQIGNELLPKEKEQMISMCSIGSRNPGIKGEDVFKTLQADNS
jgi:hypothetical protein